MVPRAVRVHCIPHLILVSLLPSPLPSSSLPTEGIFLHPYVMDSETGLTGSPRAMGSAALDAGAVHNEYSDDSEPEHGLVVHETEVTTLNFSSGQ